MRSQSKAEATASAPTPTAPAPAMHEGYPYLGGPPSGHEQAALHDSFPTVGQQVLYGKFVGFQQDYSRP